MTQKNICFFNSSRTWGGGEKWHFDMATRLNKRFYSTFVYAGKASELARRIKASPIPHETVAISNFSFFNPVKFYRIYKMLKKRQIHTIIINLSEDLKIAGPAAKLAGIQNIIYRRGSAIPVKNSFSNRFLYRHVLTGIIANSRQTKKTILENNPDLIPEEKITVIYNGIAMDRPEKNDFEPVYNRQEKEILLGNAGRLVRQKGQAYLIEIAKNLKMKGLKFKILIAGDGPLKADLQQSALDAGVSDQVIFLGFMKNIRSFMKSIDIFLLTSLWEGFGYVLVEAMAEAKPVVAFNVSSNPEIIENGKTGYLVEENNLKIFTEKILLLSENKNKRDALGAAGSIRAKTVFDLKAAVENLETFIGTLPGP